MWKLKKASIFYFLAIVLLAGASPGHALTRRYNFVVSNSAHTRLCNNKTILTINGQFPGPTIYARRGDLIIVDVDNQASQNITIHWHGVKMPRYPWSDGPEYVTQCPIRPGTKFSQRIVLSDEEGTLWWHAHSDWSRATVHGALIILPPVGEAYPFPKPQAEVPLILGEWWNADVQQVMEEYLGNGGDPNVSNAFLINGQPGDLYPCSNQNTFRLPVLPGKTYLIRMINAVMNNIMFFRIAGHTFTIVGTDAAYTKPFTADYITISPGQTIDFLLEANQPPGQYYIASRPYASAGNYDNTTATAVLQYAGNNTNPTQPPPLPNFPNFNDTPASVNFTNQLRSLVDSKHPIDVPTNITTNLFFALSINTRACANNSCAGPFGERLLASINNRTLTNPTNSSVLETYYRGMIDAAYGTDFPGDPPLRYNYTEPFVPRELFEPQNSSDVYVLEYDSTVEIVFQGTGILGGVDHPMHLHGHSFYVVGSGFGNFDRERDGAGYNLVDPPLMETIAVPINGWTAIRFRANNPGVWFMHCHFERHVSWGMGMAFIVKNGGTADTQLLPPPPDMPKC